MSRTGPRLLRGTTCLACAYRCDLAAGAARCRVRSLRNGKLRVAGAETLRSLDPIEAKPVFHFAPGSTVLSLGSFGCSLRCRYCRNADFALAAGGPAVAAQSPEALAEDAFAAGAAAVGYGFNEPLVRAERMADVFRAARERGLFTVVVTHGAATDAAVRLLGPLVDVWRVDLKGARDASYRALADGELPWGAVYRTAAVLARDHGVHVEAVTTLVPGLNDSEREVARLAGWIAHRLGSDTAWHLQRFLPAYRMRSTPQTALASLAEARRIGRACGLPHTYVHNAALPAARDTACAGCGRLLVRRRIGSTELDLAPGPGCPGCGQPAPVTLQGPAAVTWRDHGNDARRAPPATPSARRPL